jgi:hypothetical protein
VEERLMPFGKYKGKPLSELSEGYLLTLYDHNKLPKWLKEYAEENVSILRSTVKKKKPETSTPPPPKKEN